MILLVGAPDEVKRYTDAAGAVLAPLVVLAGGACIYVLYRHLLGEWILYPLTHLFDRLTAKGNQSSNAGAVSAMWYLAQRGASRGRRREAYTALRREFLPSETKKQLDLAHSEVHILYLTFLELFVLGSILFARGGRSDLAIALSVAGSAFLAAAWAADIRLHRHEFRAIVAADETERVKLDKFLRDRGYINGAA